MKKMQFLSWETVGIRDGFWKQKQEANEQITLPAEYEQCRITGRIDSVKCLYDARSDLSAGKGEFTIDGVLSENLVRDGKIPRPHHYWDSDLAKWIEGASYSLAWHPDKDVEDCIDSIVDDFEKLQKPDGYLNTYYTVVEPGKRWTNVYRMHELYCAGHLMEAAVAYFQATGKRKLLDIICKYADHIDQTFGPEEGKIHGYPGHQEIELALVRLYRVTGVDRYLKLALYFINERGKQPYFFEEEAEKYGRDPEDGGPKGILGKHYLPVGPYALFQSHLPVREQKTAEGHAVRLTYMGCAMADLAVETGDASLWTACKRLWENTTERRMFITGGVGAQDGCERFNFDYHLPNEEAYQETCASVGMVMWSARMLQAEADGRFGDIMERALYNGVLSGVSLEGDRFFYANHLAAKPEMFSDGIIRNPRMFPVRQKWFAVSCCPMNLARLIESVGNYIYAQDEERFFVHLFIDSGTAFIKKNQRVRIDQKTNYPWDNRILLTVTTEAPVSFVLGIRNPAYSECTKVSIDDEILENCEEKNGYLYIEREWSGTTELLIELDMRPVFMEAHPYVRMDAGKVAIQYGPLVYCLEEADNGKNLSGIYTDTTENLMVKWEPGLLGGANIVEGAAKRVCMDGWEKQLYRKAEKKFEDCRIRAIPYYMWSNREPGEMTVWLNSLERRSVDIT